MNLNRREVIVTTAAAVASTTLPAAEPFPPESFERETVTWIHGDPYSGSVLESPRSGETFDEAFDFAMRYRTEPEERDRYVLGLEL